MEKLNNNQGTKQNPISISVKEVAKQIRKELTKVFPGEKYSVTSQSYSMGDCVNVRWTDGRRQEEVQKVLNKFKCKTFDGSIDASSYQPYEYEGVWYYGTDSARASRELSKEYKANVEEFGKSIGIDVSNAYSYYETFYKVEDKMLEQTTNPVAIIELKEVETIKPIEIATAPIVEEVKPAEVVTASQIVFETVQPIANDIDQTERALNIIQSQITKCQDELQRIMQYKAQCSNPFDVRQWDRQMQLAQIKLQKLQALEGQKMLQLLGI